MAVTKERIKKIDFIRGIAMILVICGHSVGLVLKDNTGRLIHDIIYTFHMPLFFLVSGYIEYENHHSGSKIYKLSTIVTKDIISLYIPYLFASYLYWFERLLAGKVLGINLDRPIQLSFRKIMELCYIGDGASWFLLSLLLIKLLFDMLDKHVPDFVLFSIFSALFWLVELKLAHMTDFLAWGIFYYIGYLVNKYGVDKIRGGAEMPYVNFVY